MAERESKKGEYIQSIPVVDTDDVSVLNGEKMWEILHYVHERPLGVRPAEIARKFDIRVNQAYDKLRKLEKEGYLTRQKKRGAPGKEAQRKTLLYFSQAWGFVDLDPDFDEVLSKKYGKLVMDTVKPTLVRFFQAVLDDLKKDPELRKWYPTPNENLCPDCGEKHQALELFGALPAFATEVVIGSYEMMKVLLENGYLTKKEFNEYTTKTKDEADWVLSDKPTRPDKQGRPTRASRESIQ
jgi:Mn-dependent DtxR family transcriptional regulator